MPSSHQTDADSDLPRGLAASARRALAGAGIVRLEQLARCSEAAMSDCSTSFGWRDLAA